MDLKYLFIFIVLLVDLKSLTAQNDLPSCPNENLQWLPHLKNCARYYVCRQGQIFERSCAPGLLFNNLSGQCMFPHLVNCMLPCPQVDDPNRITFMPNYDDCSRFFICDSGRAVPRQCADGLLFDIENDWCDLPQNVECGVRGNGTNVVTTPSNPGDLATPPADLTTPSTTTIKSPDSMTTTTRRTTTFNPDRFDCPLERGPLFFHHTIHCHKYFKCYNGISYLRECTGGMGFDFFRKECTSNPNCYYPGIDETTEIYLN